MKNDIEKISKAVGKCPKCGKKITWFNDIPLRGFCWGTEEKEHSEYSVAVPTHAIYNN